MPGRRRTIWSSMRTSETPARNVATPKHATACSMQFVLHNTNPALLPSSDRIATVQPTKYSRQVWYSPKMRSSHRLAYIRSCSPPAKIGLDKVPGQSFQKSSEIITTGRRYACQPQRPQRAPQRFRFGHQQLGIRDCRPPFAPKLVGNLHR